MRAAAPLLEEKGHAGLDALIAQRARPFRVHRTRLRTTLPAADHPLEAGYPGRKIERPQQRLAGDKADNSGHCQQRRQPLVCPLLLADGRAYPDMIRPGAGAPGSHCKDVLRPLGEQQPVEHRRGLDEVPQPRTCVSDRRMLLEDIGHRGAEDAAPVAISLGLTMPAQGLLPVCLTKEAPGGGRCRAPHLVAVMPGNALRIAMLAFLRDFETAPPGIP